MIEENVKYYKWNKNLQRKYYKSVDKPFFLCYIITKVITRLLLQKTTKRANLPQKTAQSRTKISVNQFNRNGSCKSKFEYISYGAVKIPKKGGNEQKTELNVSFFLLLPTEGASATVR